MINKFSKGKEHTRRPLPVRALAILLAIAMVLSVVYISNRRNKVEAATYDDQDYLSSIFSRDSSCVVSVPIRSDDESSYHLVLPTVSQASETTTVTLGKYVNNSDSEDVKYSEDSMEGYTPVDGSVSATKTVSYSFSWKIGETVVTGISVSNSSEEQSASLYQTATTSYVAEDTTVQSLINVPAGSTEGKGTITVKPVALVPLTISKSGSTYSITDSNSDDLTPNSEAKKYVYGSVVYKFVSGGELVVPDGCTADSTYTLDQINNFVNSDSLSEGKSCEISKVVTSKSSTSTYFSNESVVLKNNVLFTDYTVSYNDGLSSSGTTNSITLTGVNPNKPVTVTLNNQEPVSDFALSGIPSTCNVSSDPNYKIHNITIPACSNPEAPTDVSFTVTMSDGSSSNNSAHSDSISVSVSYGNGKPVIKDGSGLSTNATYTNTETGVKYYANSAVSFSVGANVAENSGSTITELGVKATSPSAKTLPVEGISGNSIEESGKTVSDTLQAGANVYKIYATSSFGITTESGEITAYYDNVAPTISSISLSQDSATLDSTSSAVGESVELKAKKVCCKKDAVLAFTVNDGTGSGIKSVSCEELGVTDLSAPFDLTIPANDANNATINKKYDFVVEDNVGNKKPVSVYLDFYDDEVTITQQIVETGNKTAAYEISGTAGFLKWHADDIAKLPSNRKFSVIYTIKAATELPPTSIIYSSTSPATSINVLGSSLPADITYSTAPEKDANDIATGKTIYTIQKDFNGDSKTLSNLKIEYKNANDTTVSSDAITVLNIDSDAPTVAPQVMKVGSASGEDVDLSKWYKKDLVIFFQFTDNTGDSSKPHSDIKEITEVSGIVGDVPSVTDNSFVVTAAESTGSTDADRTNIKFTLVDNVGNKSNYSEFFKVDWTVPKTNLAITGLTVNEGESDDNLYNLQSIPSISFSPYDYPSDVASFSATISDGTTSAELNQTSTPLTDYFTVTDDKTYTVTVTVTDNAGYTNTTTKKFKVDGDKPVVTVAVDDPSAPTKGINPFYNTDVKVKLTIKDTNIDESTIQVLDNDDPVTVTWDDSDPTNLIGYYTTSTVGQHTIKITAKDDSGNAPDPEYATTTFTVDKEAPTIKTYLDDEEYNATTAYKLSSATSKMTVTDDYSRDTADERVTVKLTTPTGEVKTEVKNGAGPFTFAEDGYYELKYEAIDKAGNPASKVIGFTVDGAKPVHNMYVTTSAAKSAKYSNTYSNKVGKFNDYSDQEEYTYGQYFNTDVFIDVAYFDYNIDSVTVYDNDTPINVNWATDGGYGRGTIAISTEGYHEIKMSSVDKSGNTVTDSGYSDTVRFIIDKTSPELTPYLDDYEFSGDNTYVSNSKSQVGIVDANPDDEDITVNVIRFYPAGGSEESTYHGIDSIELPEDGYYTVTYTVVDRAGNIGSTKHGFTVDNVSPVHNMYVTVENPAKFSSYKNNYNNPVGMFKTRPNQENYDYGQYYNYNVNVELNVFDYNLDWVYVTDNGNEISPTWTWNGAYGTATVTLMSEGYHELKMWSKDLSGNETDDTDPAKMIRLYIDKTVPGITTYVNGSLYSEGSGVRYLNTNASVQVSVNDTNKDTTDLVRTSKMTPPGGSASSSTENVGETTENYSTEADYEVQYVATDLAGNKSGTRNVQFRVDKTPPQLSITGDGTSTAKSVPVSFGIKEAFYWDMTSAKYSIYKKKDGTGESLEKTTDFTPRSSNDSQSYTITEDAEYRFEFSAEDKCGNKTETKGTLIKDGTAPIILLSGVSNYDKTDKEVTLNISVDEAFYSTNKVTLTGTRTDIDGKTTNIDFNQFTTNRTKVSQLEQLFKEDGIYDITVTSTDKAGNSSTKTLHFTIDTTDPEIGDLSKYDKVKTNKFEWDVDLDELVKDLTVCDISVYMDGSLYDGTTEITDGSHVLRVEAVDELGHKSYKEVTFVLDTKGPNIIISNVEDGDRLLESTEVTVTVEIDEDILDTVSLNDKSVTVSENKATFTINSKGKYRINATAHDEAGNTSSTEIEFTFGKQANILLIAIIAGVAIILLIILMLLIKRRRENYF